MVYQCEKNILQKPEICFNTLCEFFSKAMDGTEDFLIWENYEEYEMDLSLSNF